MSLAFVRHQRSITSNSLFAGAPAKPAAPILLAGFAGAVGRASLADGGCFGGRYLTGCFAFAANHQFGRGTLRLHPPRLNAAAVDVERRFLDSGGPQAAQVIRRLESLSPG